MLKYDPSTKVSTQDLRELSRYRTTCDLADGQPCPPFIENGIPWRIIMRVAGHTVWHHPPSLNRFRHAWRSVAGSSTTCANKEMSKWQT